jgi:hypothetical protein
MIDVQSGPSAPKAKNKAAGKSDGNVPDQTRTKPPHLPEVVPRGATNDHVLQQVLQPAPSGLLVGLNYQPPVARKVGRVKPPRVDPLEVICHVYCLLLEIWGRESAATEMLG